MASLTFYLRPSENGANRPGRLYLRLTHRRRSKTLSSPYLLLPAEWDASSQDVIVNENAPRGNIPEKAKEYISNMRGQFQKIITGELSQRVFYTVEEVLSLLCPFRYSGESFVEYTLALSGQMEKKGKDRTARAYRSAVGKLLGFTRSRDICFADITPSLIAAFEEYLKAKGKRLNTISFYMRNLRVVYRKAQGEGLIGDKDNPFKGVFTGFHKTAKRALDISHMQRLQELDYSKYLERDKHPFGEKEEKLYTAWRLFIFCFHARGMCFIDMAYLRKDNIRGGIIRYYRKKTGGSIEVKITPLMQKIIDSFSHETENSPYLFPVITSIGKKERLQYETGLRMQNRRLKELAKKAGIGMPLTTHVSRHSWASIAKRENLPLWGDKRRAGTQQRKDYLYLSGRARTLTTGQSQRKSMRCGMPQSGTTRQCRHILIRSEKSISQFENVPMCQWRKSENNVKTKRELERSIYKIREWHKTTKVLDSELVTCC